MAVRSIIDIEVNDESFQKFRESFSKYHEAVTKSPETWRKVGAEVHQTELSFEKMAALLLAQTELTHRIAEQGQQSRRTASDQARSWRDMARNAGRFASHITSATRSLLRWASLTTVFSGLLGAGGLFGIERLATSAAGQRRSSLGLGVTAGQQRAFGVNYGRVVDADSFLGSVNEALHDVTKRAGLYGAGFGERDLRGRNSAEVASALLPRLKEIVDQNPDEMLAQVLHSRQLDQFISLQDAQRLKATPVAELARYGEQFRLDAERLNLTKDQLRAWQDLRVQLTRAGSSIEATFIRGLTPLAPQIARLSEGFSKLAEAFLGSPVVKEWIDNLAAGIKMLAEYIETPAFKKDVETFVDGVGRLATGIVEGLRFLGVLAPSEDAKKDADTPGTDAHRRERAPGLPGWGYTPGLGWHWTPLTPPDGGGQQGSDAGSAAPFGRERTAHDFFRAKGWSEAQTAGLLAAMKGESGFRTDAFNPAGGGQGAQGVMQWRGPRIDAFRRIYGHDPRYGTFGEQLAFTQWELENTEKRAGNRLRATTGPREAAEEVLRSYGRPAPRELAALAQQRGGWAEQYARRMGGGPAQAARAAGGMRIIIDNNTGGNAIITASQLPA